MNFKSIVILTGAGISAESGIKTFRDTGGLWESVKIEDVATPEAFEKDPDFVLEFYNKRRRQLLDGSVKPNAAHESIAQLECGFSGDFLLVTQNIDDLHERAGSKKILHMHGELLKARCLKSGEIHSLKSDISVDSRCTCCKPASGLRPHVVWFGEIPLDMDTVFASLARCDLFIAIGTSGNVYPAAGFVQMAKKAGARCVELNLEPSAVSSTFDDVRYGKATEIVPPYVDELKSTSIN